ncbi:MAG: glycosyltransferase family 39 protein, partial [Candidatus Sumerlaeia bacterium]|nr:glycosyltransferase family 39 protein [Candidatus Sumerlaeia bacterium]
MSERKIKYLLFCFLLSYYVLFFGGTFYASDEIIIARQSQSLVESQRLNFPPTFGRSDSPYGILNTLMGIPPYLVFKAITNFTGSSDLFPRWNIFALTNLLISPLIMVVIFNIIRHFNVPLNISLYSSLLAGITTEFLTYGKTFFTEPLFTLFLLLSVFYIYRSWQLAGSLKFPLYAGIFFAAALHSRFIAIFYVPAIIIFILGTNNETIAQRMKKLLLFLLPVSLAILLWMWLNYVMRGGILRSGYETSTFSGHLFSGVFGLLLSPGRGFFIHNPWAFVAVAVFPLFYKHQPRLALFTLVLFLITLVSYARFWTWHGGWTPGCRFLLPMAPLVFLWLIPLFIEMSAQSTYIVFWRGIGIILFGLSCIFQAGKTLVNVLDYNNELFGLVGGESPFLFIPQTSALAGIKHLILDGNLDVMLFKYWGEFPTLIVPLYLIVLCVLGYCGHKIWGVIFLRRVNLVKVFI